MAGLAMKQEDVIRMAREAGFNTEREMIWVDGLEISPYMQRFAALVAAAERERIIAQNAPEIEKINAYIKALEDAVAAERKACAKVCDHMASRCNDMRAAALEVAAESICARGQQ